VLLSQISDIDYFNIFNPININKNIDPSIDPNQYSMLREAWAPYRQFDIPQPRREREGFGRNIKAFRSLDQKKGSLIRTHGKLRRREIHPVHRSCLVNVSEI